MPLSATPQSARARRREHHAQVAQRAHVVRVELGALAVQRRRALRATFSVQRPAELEARLGVVRRRLERARERARGAVEVAAAAQRAARVEPRARVAGRERVRVREARVRAGAVARLV